MTGTTEAADTGLTDVAIGVAELHVVRGKRRVLDHVSLAVPRGQVVGLLGPSGSGKTTLMRAVVGVQNVRSGTVTVLGRPAGDGRLRRSVAYMTQAASVYGDLTVTANLRYSGRLQGLRRGDLDADVERVLDAVGLTGLRPPASAGCPVASATGSASEPRCSGSHNCSGWTSPRSGWTPCCGGTSGTCSPGSRGAGSPSSSPAT